MRIVDIYRYPITQYIRNHPLHNSSLFPLTTVFLNTFCITTHPIVFSPSRSSTFFKSFQRTYTSTVFQRSYTSLSRPSPLSLHRSSPIDYTNSNPVIPYTPNTIPVRFSKAPIQFLSRDYTTHTKHTIYTAPPHIMSILQSFKPLRKSVNVYISPTKPTVNANGTVITSSSFSNSNTSTTTSSSSSSNSSSSVEIDLTIQEQQIIYILQETIKKYNLSTQLRIAGGWVRDKLLGKSNDDIDIAVDNMMGSEFAKYVVQYMNETGIKTTSIGVIQANPEQSKHLETATTRVLDMWLDFVHLRTEIYTPDSRIPQVHIGTPEQDAARRDFTINALFYNISTNTIEDLTGSGMDDLHAQIIRTPLPPLVTFLDDPLRVLRAIRFASRYGFALIHELRECMYNPQVVKALLTKVSRDRVGIETEGMLAGSTARPIAALRALHNVELLHAVYLLPEAVSIQGDIILPLSSTNNTPTPTKHYQTRSTVSSSSSSSSTNSSSLPTLSVATTTSAANISTWLGYSMQIIEAIDYLSKLVPDVTMFTKSIPIQSHNKSLYENNVLGIGINKITDNPVECLPDYLALSSSFSIEARRYLVHAGILFPLYLMNRINSKNKSELLVPILLSETLKQPNKTSLTVYAIQTGTYTFLQQFTAAEFHRLDIAQCLRKDVKEHWLLSLYLATAIQIENILFRYVKTNNTKTIPETYYQEIHDILNKSSQLYQSIMEWKIDGCWTWKPLLDGKTVGKLTGISGPALGTIMDKQMEYRLLHPLCTTEECQAYILSIANTDK